MRTSFCALGLALVAASASADKLYTIDPGSDTLQILDTETMQLTNVGPIGVPFDFGGLAWDGETLWMVQGFAGTSLYTIDLETGAATFVGDFGLSQMFGLAHDPTVDRLFGSLSTTGTGFYDIDRETGAANLIGNPGINLDGLSYDPTRDVLVGAFAGPGDLYAIDRETGQGSLLYDGDFFNNCGITYVPSLDEHWMVDWSGNLYSFDPTTGYQRTLLLSGLGAHDGLANVTPSDACAADCNGDGQLNVLDFVCFQTEWQNQTALGDCDGNGLYDILDFVCFQGEFQQGCP